MYLVSVTTRVVPGRVTEALSAAERIFEPMRTQPGFISATVLHSLGGPGLYLITVRWESRAAAEAWRTSEARQAQDRERLAEGLVIPVTPPAASEIIDSVADDEFRTNSKGIVVRVWNIDQGPAAARAFVDSRIQLMKLLKEHAEDYVGGLVLRSLGDPRTMTVAHGFAIADGRLGGEYAGGGEIPGVAELIEANPPSNFTSAGGPVSVSRWEVTMRVTP